MMGFAFCERCGVPIAAFGPTVCDRCQLASVLQTKRVRITKKVRTR